jgi:hypothetical protein
LNSVGRRFDRGAKKGVWLRVFEALQDPDWEWILLDSTVVRAPQHAAGAPKKRRQRGPGGEALDRSRGGVSAPIPLAVDALGNPTRFRLTPGQES